MNLKRFVAEVRHSDAYYAKTHLGVSWWPFLLFHAVSLLYVTLHNSRRIAQSEQVRIGGVILNSKIVFTQTLKLRSQYNIADIDIMKISDLRNIGVVQNWQLSFISQIYAVSLSISAEDWFYEAKHEAQSTCTKIALIFNSLFRCAHIIFASALCHRLRGTPMTMTPGQFATRLWHLALISLAYLKEVPTPLTNTYRWNELQRWTSRTGLNMNGIFFVSQ